MAESIQRVPRGLSDLLSTFGGYTPRLIGEQITGVLELLQMYGLQQRTAVTQTAAATALGGFQTLSFNPTAWSVLFAATASYAKTATQTALAGRISLSRGNVPSLSLFATQELGPYGATASGSSIVGGYLPYPLLCPPGSQLFATVDVLGTDANVNVGVQAEFGLLG